MIVFRITHAEYATHLQASGLANRWNVAGQYVIYTSGSISLCALELLAHTNGIRPAGTFKIMRIEIADSASIYEINLEKLPENWHLLSAYPFTQKTGSAWYKQAKEVAMKIPSAIIPSESNYAINASYPEFKKNIRLIRTEDFFWDHRFPSE